eukprot:symbB.v1.2.017620.t1/scaffold1340.1/size241236/5
MRFLPRLLILRFCAAFQPWHPCPPPDAFACVANVRGTSNWELRAQVDKALSQRTYELVTIHDWIPKEDEASRATAIQGLETMEVARQILCAATFAPCDSEGLKNALMMLSVESSNKRSAAEQVIDKCTDLGEDVKSSLGSCSYAIWTWADAEYFVSAQDFMPESKPQTSEESDRLNLKKRDSDSGFPAPVFPPRFSPAGVCSESLKWMPNKNGLQPVFSGEAFGDVSWVDVSNLRTRHLSAISLLETLENGKAFQRRHPEGLSRVAVNLGGGDGVCRVGHGVDPVNCFFVLGFGGVVFEANKSLSSDLHESFGKFGEHIQILMEPAEAETISERLAEAMSKRPGRPVERDEIDIIKVDVDGLDCHLVQALKVGEWRPKVWHVEINPLFPPGIALWPNGSTLGVATTTNQRELSSAFSRRGESDGKQAFVGCSLQALLDAVGSDYVLIHVEFENAVLLRKDISEALEPWLSSRSMVQKWRDGYFCHPIARVRLPHDYDQDSLFLQYDFRRWGDPTLKKEKLLNLVKDFLHHFVKDGTYSFEAPPEIPPQPSTLPPLVFSGQTAIQDLNCDSKKGHVFQWPIILINIESLLSSWASGRGDLEVVLTAIVEDFAGKLNIDRAWPIFKTVAAWECPLGGLAMAIAMRWRCLSGFWKENPIFPATAEVFGAMSLRLRGKGR